MIVKNRPNKKLLYKKWPLQIDRIKNITDPVTRQQKYDAYPALEKWREDARRNYAKM